MTCVKFSPIRPTVFAVSSSDGFLYLYDLSETTKIPVVVFDSNEHAETPGTIPSKGVKANKKQNESPARVALTSFCFNHKQRDLIASCDWNGRVQIWKLSWKYANRVENEDVVLQRLSNILSEEDS